MADINPIIPVAAEIKPVQGMSLGDMVNLARGVQAYQQAEQVNPLTLEKARQEIQQAQYKTTQDKLTTEKQTRGYASSLIAGHLADPDFDLNKPNPEAMVKKLEATKRYWNDLGIPTPAEKTLTGLIDATKKDPQQAVQAMRTMAQQSLTNAEQGAQLNAPASFVNTGQMAVPLYQSPYQGGGAGRTPAVQMQLPVGQQVVAQPGDNSGLPPGTPYILGPQGQQATGPKLATGQAPLVAAAGNVVAQDWADTSKRAADAQNRIGVFQNIKKFAPDAFTGVGGARKELAAGVLNAIGIPAYEAEKISSEELAKNSALLALAGGNTDAARALAEVATPNKKLNEQSIKAIANQMIGIEKMAQAKANFLAPVSGDQAQYQERLQVFNQVADPRLFQESTPEDVAKMKARMSQAEIADFGRRVKLLKQMGLVQ